MQIDPLSDEYPGISPYAYALNNPLIFNDPTGEFPVCTNCDEVYEQGAMVSNKYGNFEYLGNDTWKDVDNDWTFGSEVGQQFEKGIAEGATEFNIYPDQSEAFTIREGRYVLAENTGVRGSFTLTGGYSVNTLGDSESSLSVVGVMHTAMDRGDIDVSANIGTTQNGSLFDRATLTQGAGIYPTNSIPLGGANVNLPKVGNVGVQFNADI